MGSQPITVCCKTRQVVAVIRRPTVKIRQTQGKKDREWKAHVGHFGALVNLPGLRRCVGRDFSVDRTAPRDGFYASEGIHGTSEIGAASQGDAADLGRVYAAAGGHGKVVRA